MKQDDITTLTGLGAGHMSQDPEGLGLHGGTAAAPVQVQVQVLLCGLDGLIDGGGAVYEAIFYWESTATTDRTPPPPPKPGQYQDPSILWGGGSEEVRGSRHFFWK